MKTAISLPDELFTEVERLVRHTGRSRSEVYAEALREYVSRHAPDEVTVALNRLVEDLGERSASPEFASAAAQHTLGTTEW